MKSESQSAGSSKPIVISDELAAKCNGPDQFSRFDQLFRSMIAVPKSAINKEEKKWKRKQAKKRTRKQG
jgi:hypothetical protein